MLGKRSCPFRRTTSMSQLGPRPHGPCPSGEPLTIAAATELESQEPLSTHTPPHPHPLRLLSETEERASVSANCPTSAQAEFAQDVLVEGQIAGSRQHPDFCDEGPGGMLSFMGDQDALWAQYLNSLCAVQEKLRISENGDHSIRPVDFLEVCFLCKRRLRHEKDIFMYRGDTAFCSEECRHRQIHRDEKRRSAASCKKASETAVAA